MLLQITHPQNFRVLAASEVVEADGSTALIISAGINGEANAEIIISAALEKHNFPSISDVIVLWSTPASASVTGKALLRRLQTTGSSLEWGPNLVMTDAAHIHLAAKRCNSEVEMTC